jgi:LDH2 family malate/lactate/ureidoglycolate dehydrogenase
MVEILSGVLGGGAMASEVGGVRTVGRPARNSQTFLGIDVARFMPLGVFRERMQRLVADVKSAPPAAGYDEVLVAGEPEWRAQQLRSAQGIPLSRGVWEKLTAAARRLGVDIPPARES